MLANNMELRGIVPVLLTPLKESRQPDVEGMERLVNFLIEAGVGGMWVLGSASEDINIHRSVRSKSLKAAAIANRSRIPLIVGSGLTAIDEIFEFFDEIADLPVHGVHVLPYDVKMGDDRLIHFFTTLADRAPVPLWMYHNPKRGKLISKKVILEMREHPNMGGIKVGGYSLTELTTAMMLRTSQFDVIGAGGGQLYTMLGLGANAHTTSEASAFPEPFIEIYNLFQEGKHLEARTKQFELIQLSQAIPRTENGEYAAEEKFILSLRGICQGYVNQLYRNLTDNEKDQIRLLFRRKGFAWAQ
jgi:4-hydroxy-tetrahydrodipicolinate synthase